MWESADRYSLKRSLDSGGEGPLIMSVVKKRSKFIPPRVLGDAHTPTLVPPKPSEKKENGQAFVVQLNSLGKVNPFLDDGD